jgi:hypothetical protein
MSFSRSTVADGSKLVGSAGPIGQTATGTPAVRIEYFPRVRGATALGLWSDSDIPTRCASLKTNTFKSVQPHGYMDLHARLGANHGR